MDDRNHEEDRPLSGAWSLAGVSLAVGITVIALVLIVLLVWLLFAPEWFARHGD
jgi:hypothetical protein